MALNRNKYRIESARLKNWDYSAPGYYFITICTKDRECVLGNIFHGKMKLSEIGKIVESEWLKSFEIRAELDCDEYCIMPNHIHGIVIINKSDSVETHGRASLQMGPLGFNNSLQTNHSIQSHKSSKPVAIRAPKSISSFVAGFKSSVTIKINELYGTPQSSIWQSRFHDHILRDNNELTRIREYIVNNPLNWNSDDYFEKYPENNT